MVDELLLAVDIELEMAGGLDVDNVFACFLRGEGGLILGGEILDGQIGGEDVHAGGGHVDGLRIVLGGEGLAGHLGVVPEGALQAFLAIWSHAVGSEMAFHHLVVGEVAAWDIDQLLLLGFNAVEDGDGVIGRTVIVTPHHRLVAGIGADDGNLLGILLQRQDVALVLQEHDALAGHVEGYLCRGFRRHGGVGDLRPLHELRIIHFAQIETTFEQADDVLVDLCLGDVAALHCLGDTLIGIAEATLHVGTCQRGLGRSMDGT